MIVYAEYLPIIPGGNEIPMKYLSSPPTLPQANGKITMTSRWQPPYLVGLAKWRCFTHHFQGGCGVALLTSPLCPVALTLSRDTFSELVNQPQASRKGCSSHGVRMLATRHPCHCFFCFFLTNKLFFWCFLLFYYVYTPKMILVHLYF